MEAEGTRAKEGHSPSQKPRRAARKIILFSDGTGNSSGKLFKTNVWRLYEAVDLGPGRDGAIEQIALYSNGVGTSSFRPLAMLGGVFGVGLKSNILALYKYLCRNWMPGDEIYLFGFSRGAFTIRLLTGLIARQGILRGADNHTPPDEDRLAYMARAAYRAFSGEAWPNRLPARAVAKRLRAVRDWALELHRRATGRIRYNPTHNCLTDLAFVGVWDTVAAYGGPIIEITRGIDDWIWPLTMPNYQLTPRVLKARHAMSLDDERDAFQPLLWDEVREEALVSWGGEIRVNGKHGLENEVRKVSEGRLKQVWFSGMHADVGGGYSDESLSFVSLLWMIDELDGALRLLPEHVERISSMANSYGPLHNSRAGLGAYYRFQPRRIAALVDWRAADNSQDLVLAASTRAMRDPAIADTEFTLPDRPGETPTPPLAALAEHIRRDHGLLLSVRVHESIVDRIYSGTDNYAPLSLPRKFDIVFAKRNGLSQRVLAADVAKAIRDERRQSTADDSWFARQSRTWEMVAVRRLQYFGTAFATFLLATMPLWDNILTDPPRICADSRCVARPLLQGVDAVTGGRAGPWVDAFSRNLLFVLILGAITIGLFAWSSAYDLRLRSRARRAWRVALGMEAKSTKPPKARGSMAVLRGTPGYQHAATLLKWYIAPTITGWSMILLSLGAATAFLFQLVVYPVVERRDALCRDDRNYELLDENGVAFFLDIARPCTVSQRSVEARLPYRMRVTMLRDAGQPADGTARWFDGRTAATPAIGESADLPWWADFAGMPFRRVMSAGWLQPLVAVQRPSEPESLRQRLIGREVRIEQPALVCDPASGSYVGEFRPAIAGTLRLFVNDALLPWRISGAYANNRGFAIVQVWPGANATQPVLPRSSKWQPLRCSVAAE
ncbi:MAG: hypothetical protein JWM38_2109 [Sphingomonas bacterium]|nr:hypothetical protein [Sphingomonas bacterium]